MERSTSSLKMSMIKHNKKIRARKKKKKQNTNQTKSGGGEI